MKNAWIKFCTILGPLVLFLTGCATTPQAPPRYPVINTHFSDTVDRNTYTLPQDGGDIVGHVFTVTPYYTDTPETIAKRYDVGIRDIKEANPNLGECCYGSDVRVIIPKALILPPKHLRHGIVINIPEMQLYYFTDDQKVMTFPIAVGKKGWPTPLMDSYVYRKQKYPTWYVPESVAKDYFRRYGENLPKTFEPGPENPLGDYAIYLQYRGILIHGTNNQYGIGEQLSSGCIRMRNIDIEKIFSYVKFKTPVKIIYYEDKVGIHKGNLYVQGHKSLTHESLKYKDQSITAKQVLSSFKKKFPVEPSNISLLEALNDETGIPKKLQLLIQE